jgi:hypothetical protein
MKTTVRLAALVFALILVGAAARANQPLLSSATHPVAMTALPAALAVSPIAQNNTNNPPPATQQNPNAAAPPPAHGRKMPKTASSLPEIALFGFLALFGIGGIRLLTRKLT